MTRKKTKKAIKVPILPTAKKIIDKYLIDPSAKLPLYSNHKFNVYLKDIGVDLNLRTKLTHQLARRTFATSVLLSRGIPIEIVKELLEHIDITTTMASNATVNRKLIIDHLKKLK